MHLFKIEAWTLNEEGTKAVKCEQVHFADDWIKAKEIYDMLSGETLIDGNPRYKVNLYVFAYKQVASPSSFFSQFQA